jgi:hypothetical protein
MRTCEVCLKMRPKSHYAYAPQNYDGLHKWCDKCRIEYFREYLIKTGKALPKKEPDVKEKTVRIRQKRVAVEKPIRQKTTPVRQNESVDESEKEPPMAPMIWVVNHEVTFD